jgi:hypothetical protein
MIKSLLFFVLFVASISPSRSTLIPVDRLTDWTPGIRTGVVGGIPTRTTISGDGNGNGITDSLENIDKTGTTNVQPAIQAAINAASVDQVVRLPAGTFQIDSTLYLDTNFSGKTLRGAGMNATIIDVNCNQGIVAGSGSGYYYPPSPLRVTAGLTRGSTSITVSGDLVVNPGSYILLLFQNDTTLPVVSVYNYDVFTNQSPMKSLH